MPPRQGEHPSDPYDVLVVGSGFGGSVTALRLAEKGYRVGVLEAGRRFTPETLPATSWDIRNFLWAPRLGCYGIQRIHVLRDVLVLAGAGVGGGSLNYANTLYRPKNDAFYRDPQWASHDRLARRAGRVLRPGHPHARRRHAAVGDAVGRGDAPGRGRARARGHGGTDAGRRVLRRGPRRDVARPVLRRRRARAHRLPRVRRVHDRLPPRRQEHPRDELPRAGRAGGRDGAPGDDGAHGPSPGDGRLRGRDPGARAAGGGRPTAPSTWCSPRAPGARRRCCTACATRACCRASRGSSAS